MTRRAHAVRRGALWVLLYAALLTAPLLVLASGLSDLPGSGWWFDFAMGLGFGALALMGGQFLLTARFRHATSPFGIDVVYQFHRWLAVGGLSLLFAHWLILRLRYPAALVPWMPGAAPFYMTAGRVALLLFALLVGSSLWRRALRIEYDRWRVAHAVMAAAAVALALVHVRGVGYYTGVFWNRTLIDLFVASLVAVVLHVRVLKPILEGTQPYRVRAVRPQRGDAWTLTLEPVGHEGMRFLPGQFGWLSLGRAPWRAGEHPFSFSSAPAASGALEMTIKELGDFTRKVKATEVGTVAYVDGPHGSFSVDLHPEAPGYFFLAGGIGIAPIVSMLRALAERGDRRPLWLVLGNSRPDRAIFLEEIESLRERLDLRFTHVVQEPPEGWKGEVGLPSPQLIRTALEDAPRGIHCYLCGPVPMSRMAQRALRELGVPMRRVHFELFEMA
jgi:predicted ferric reductase